MLLKVCEIEKKKCWGKMQKIYSDTHIFLQRYYDFTIFYRLKN